jgi:hypothetical protein
MVWAEQHSTKYNVQLIRRRNYAARVLQHALRKLVHRVRGEPSPLVRAVSQFLEKRKAAQEAIKFEHQKLVSLHRLRVRKAATLRVYRKARTIQRTFRVYRRRRRVLARIRRSRSACQIQHLFRQHIKRSAQERYARRLLRTLNPGLDNRIPLRFKINHEVNRVKAILESASIIRKNYRTMKNNSTLKVGTQKLTPASALTA